MKKITCLIIAALVMIIITSCRKDIEFVTTKSNGIIQKQGFTTYMYGTHILTNSNGEIIYALKSDKYNLDNYVNRNVEIKGHKYKNYPVDCGPDFLEVTSVK